MQSARHCLQRGLHSNGQWEDSEVGNDASLNNVWLQNAWEQSCLQIEWLVKHWRWNPTLGWVYIHEDSIEMLGSHGGLIWVSDEAKEMNGLGSHGKSGCDGLGPNGKRIKVED
jgi:hypothetical protein